MKGPYEDLISAWNSSKAFRDERIRSLVRNRRGIDIEQTRKLRASGSALTKLKDGYIWRW